MIITEYFLMENDVRMLILFLIWFMLLCPTLSLLLNMLSSDDNCVGAARVGGNLTGVGFIVSLGMLTILATEKASFYLHYININTLSLSLSSLVLFVSFVVNRFSIRYMDGDRLYKKFFSLLAGLTLSAVVMVLSDNMYLFWLAWSLSNSLLVMLMVHKKEWKASKNSGILALKNLAPGSLCLLVAFIILNVTCSTSSISGVLLIEDIASIPYVFVTVALIVLGGLIQSAIWPFHRWLLSSLNSPTPVSALMHAGLVNGGGILVVKFAPLIAAYPSAMSSLFLLGALSAVLGTIWKLMQIDMKRMLACSTFAQMGFMMVQCGLGLFSAAIAHLCWHGLFKAYLFLNSGSALKQGPADNKFSCNKNLILALSIPGGLAAMLCFVYMANKELFTLHPTTFVIFFAFMAGAQLMYTMLQKSQSVSQFVFGVVAAATIGLIYGLSMHFIEKLLPHLMLEEIHSLSVMHWAVLVMFITLWASFNLNLHKNFMQSRFGCWLYMQMFNASQPSVNTVTALRKDYSY